jgi:ubiquinone/menaquinone biosynthesis C-methylase UbiE
MQNVERFTGRVADYERYRLRYPWHVIEVLNEHGALSQDDLVADVGAGTGMVAELFLENGNWVIAVEPNAEMRAACEKKLSHYDGFRLVDAAAEQTGLDDASVDLVAVGRAFHWFDRGRALAEFRRILKPGGWVALMTNHRKRDGSERMREFEAILVEHGVDYTAMHGKNRGWEGLKPYGECEETFFEEMPGEESLTFEEFLGQTQSYSVAPLPGHEKYEGMQRALREFFAKWHEGDVIRLETVCSVAGWRTPCG